MHSLKNEVFDELDLFLQHEQVKKMSHKGELDVHPYFNLGCKLVMNVYIYYKKVPSG
jgi:hypothetical protein